MPAVKNFEKGVCSLCGTPVVWENATGLAYTCDKGHLLDKKPSAPVNGAAVTLRLGPCRYFVLAPTFDQAKAWAESHKLSQHGWYYAGCVADTAGFSPSEKLLVVVVATDTQVNEAVASLEQRGFKYYQITNVAVA